MSNRKTYTFVGKGPITGDHRDGPETGELTAGDRVLAWPVHPEHPGFLWRVLNLRNGFTMTCPPHDLREVESK